MIEGAEIMRKEKNTAIVLLLTLILITLVILCILLAADRLGTGEQSVSDQEVEETEQMQPKMQEEEVTASAQEETPLADEQDENLPEQSTENASPLHKGQYEVALEGISLYFPEEGIEPWLTEKAYPEGDQVLVTEQGMPRTIVELVSLEPVVDPLQPFVPYDTTYAEAETIEEHTFASYPAKSYFIQKYVEEGGVSGYENTIIYCIQLDQQMAVIAFKPARGLGGISSQAEGFEQILDSIELN